jgi:hypothetical protein
MSMNEQIEHLIKKIEGLIDEAYEDPSLCGGYPPEYKFLIEMPPASWEAMDKSDVTISRAKIDRPNFLWKSQVVVRGSKWGIIKP